MEERKISCIAIDDEPLALEKMEKYIRKISYLNLCGSFFNAFQALKFLRKQKVDLMFLDVQMDEFNGIQLLEVLQEKPKVVLTTAFDQYALKGYELEVTDYLLKPIGFQRFLKTTERIYKELNIPSDNFKKEEQSAHNKHLMVRSDYRLQKIHLDDILYIEGRKGQVLIQTLKGSIQTLQNLKKLEAVLPSPPFIRVHKSFIVSTEHIKSIGKNDLTIKDQTIPLGGIYKKRFEAFFNNWILEF